MRPQTEELLYFLLCTAETFIRPNWRNVNDSFETWAFRNGLGRRLVQLDRQKLIERHPAPDLSRVVRLTQTGHRLALGGRDPTAQWGRPWDGNWRFVLFDLPTHRVDLRRQLLRVLRRHHFGYLQKSVWATPDEAGAVRATLGEAKVQPDTFLVLEGRPAAGESDNEIVEAAWDFTLINQRYEQCLALYRKNPPLGPRLAEWGRQENAAWKNATLLDPLLPSALLPPGYLGREVLRRRKQAFAHIARSMSAAIS